MYTIRGEICFKVQKIEAGFEVTVLIPKSVNGKFCIKNGTEPIKIASGVENKYILYSED